MDFPSHRKESNLKWEFCLRLPRRVIDFRANFKHSLIFRKFLASWLCYNLQETNRIIKFARDFMHPLPSIISKRRIDKNIIVRFSKNRLYDIFYPNLSIKTSSFFQLSVPLFSGLNPLVCCHLLRKSLTRHHVQRKNRSWK